MRTIRNKLSQQKTPIFSLLALVSLGFFAACGTDEAPDDGGGGNAGSDGGGGPRWILGGWLSTEDAYTGYLSVVDDISAEGEVDLSRAVEFPGDIVWEATEDGVVYVGQEGVSTIERWVVEGDSLEKDGEVNLANFGVTETLGKGRNVIQIVDDEKAYYFDTENLQVVVFHPTELTTIDSFSLDGFEEEGQTLGLNFIHRDGDRFIVTARYWAEEDETTTKLVRAAFIDSSDDSVTYASDPRCGEVAFNAVDEDGNLYVGSHPGNAVSNAAGFGGDDPSDSCVIRIQKGASEFDAEYYLDLAEVSEGGIVGGLFQGPGNTAYVYSYTGETITAEGYGAALRGENWEVYAIELGDEATDFTKVSGLGKYAPYGESFQVTVDGETRSYLTTVDAAFASGQYFDVSAGTSAEGRLSFPGFPGRATTLR